MNRDQQLELCRAYLQTAAAVESHGTRLAKPDGPVVTLSRAAGARGRTIAAVLVNRLQTDDSIPQRQPWALFDQNLIGQVVADHQLSDVAAGFLPEDGKPDEIHNVIGEILGLHPGTHALLRKTAETIRRLAVAGNAVVVGRGGNFITADIQRAVHVRLVGSPECRIRHYAEITHLDHRSAADEVKRLDRARQAYIRRNFKHDIDDPLGYDMTLDTDRLTDDDAAAIIHTLLRRRIREGSSNHADPVSAAAGPGTPRRDGVPAAVRPGRPE